MKIKITNGPIKHDKAVCKTGEVLEMSETDGKRLVALGVAEPIGGEVTAKTTTPSTTGGKDDTDPLAGVVLDFDKMTRDELAQELALRAIVFKKTASRDDLVTLLKEAAANQ
jgi:hypothetical protein